MPRKKDGWKKQDETNWLILDKLTRKNFQKIPDLERGKPKLAHTSVRKGVIHLQNKFLIKPVSEDKTIPLRPIITYGVTFLGLIVWFVEKMNNSSTQSSVIFPTYFKKILPTISKNWKLLSKFYEVKQMEKLLAKVFSNMEILAYDPIIIKYKTFYKSVIMEFKNVQEHKIFHNILELVKSNKFRNDFEIIVNFAFLLELYKLYDKEHHYYDEVTGIIGKSNIKDWLKIVNSNKKFKESVQIGFTTMKDYAESTNDGLRNDLDIILGEGKLYCDVCGQNYEETNKSKHFDSHGKAKIIDGMDEHIRNHLRTNYLLSRTHYEYELDFQKDKVFRFDKFFKNQSNIQNTIS